MRTSVWVLLIVFIFVTASYAQETKSEKVLIGFKGQAEAGIVQQMGGRVKYSFHLIPVVAAQMSKRGIDKIKSHPSVEYIEEDAEACAIQGMETIPWGVERTDPKLFFASGNMGRGVKVAILDTGIDYNHPDLADNYKGGFNFVQFNHDPRDEHGHGTHCAGVIAAGYNGFGVVGIAPQAELYALKVLNKNGKGRYSDIIAGIEWAVDNGMNIISMSFGSYKHSRALEAACEKAYQRGVLLIAASGNEGLPQVMYPAKYPSVMAVSATDGLNNFAPWSNYGEEIELAAPGTDIVSTVPGRYASFWGTSMACPHVTGVAALIFASKPNKYDSNRNHRWDAGEVRRCLRESALDLGISGKDSFYGYGLVNAYAAALLPANSHNIALKKFVVPRECLQGEAIPIEIIVTNESDQETKVTVTLMDDTYNILIDSKVLPLAAGSDFNVKFLCPTNTAMPGPHLIKAQITSLLNELNLKDNFETATVTIKPLINISMH